MTFTPRPQQQEILNYNHGRMGISAVPGSGKTHTLSALAAKIIRSGILTDQQEVLIVTLVNSAVDNFTSRIREFLKINLPFGYRVRTLHGLAHDIVREKPAMVGLEERFTILDEREADLLRRETVHAWLHNHSGELESYFLKDMDENKRDWVIRQQLPDLISGIALALIRTAKDHRLTPEKLRSLLDQSPASLPLAEMGHAIYSDYQRALIYRGAVDFDDLIRLAIELLEADQEFLERLRFRWPYILEDEAQDSSLLQEQILRLLAGTPGNWVRVGDPNQAIFATFTTASPQHLLKFIHAEADQYRELKASGRCQPSIIALANQLISWVNNEHPEPAVRDALTVPFIQPSPAGDPQPNPPDQPSGIRLVGRKYSPEEEIQAVVNSISHWLPEHQDSTVAVLVPRNQRGVEVIEALQKNGINFVELLGSTSSTRAAAGRLADVAGSLADPQSSTRLAKAYLAWSRQNEEQNNTPIQQQASEWIRKCNPVEAYLSPRPSNDWLASLAHPAEDEQNEIIRELELFRQVAIRWQGAIVLPIDQLILILSQDLFTFPGDLALAHKLALLMQEAAIAHPDWRLPELTAELGLISRNERRFIGFNEDDSGFDPSHHKGKVVVSTMHKAKGLEWERVYLMSINNYDFPSLQPNDRYISEKWFIRSGMNLEAETLDQLKAAINSDEYGFYEPGTATLTSRQDYVRERLRLLYVGITRAKRELIITWNTGRQGDQTQALPLVALSGWWEVQQSED